MWIVKLALRRPYTFVAAAVLIAILGGIAIARMPTGVLPDINIPVARAADRASVCTLRLLRGLPPFLVPGPLVGP